MKTASRTGSIRRALLAWYRSCRRDLPWRRTGDAYAIWLSEVMLQQTQVATVIPYYHRFLERFPTIAGLAAASEDEVLTMWSGLGYYSRARNMQKAARAVSGHHGGRMPGTLEALRALPGVGDYTAAAVASIAFGLPHAVLDGNVARVLCRLDTVSGDDRRPTIRAKLWQRAQEYLDPVAPGDWNQAMMELGALICLPKSPRCEVCPLSGQCHARRSGEPTRYPERAPRRASVQVDWTVAAVVEAGRLLLVRSTSAELFRGMWELPWVEAGPAGLVGALLAKYELAVTSGEEFALLQHSITFRRVRLHAVVCRLDGSSVAEGDQSRRWVEPGSLGGFGLSSIARKVVEAASGSDVLGSRA